MNKYLEAVKGLELEEQEFQRGGGIQPITASYYDKAKDFITNYTGQVCLNPNVFARFTASSMATFNSSRV